MTELQKWIQIRKELYRQVKEQVQNRLGRQNIDLQSYQKNYDKEFKSKWRPSTQKELFLAIEKAKIIFLGDFHALLQSQKAQLRILKHLQPNSPVILMLECVESKDQEILDRYMHGKISEREFLKKIKWQEKWGFPWDSYRSLLKWAQKHKVQVYGLNQYFENRSQKSLNKRDQHAAHIINQVHQKNPEAQIFVIYGELHLAQKHLPAVFAKKAKMNMSSNKILTIYQNSEDIYFQMLSKDLEFSVDIVQMRGNQFCMMSVPPWVKWQNYLIYLENTYDRGFDEDDALDFTDHVGSYAKLISEELGFKVNLASLSVYSADDSGFWKLIEQHYSKDKALFIEYLIEDEVSFYLPEIHAAYLARATVNHAASLAMQFVYFESLHIKNICLHFPEDFLARIWLEGISYFGSKLINHKRKTDTMSDIKASLSQRSGTERGREEIMLALSQKMHELMFISGQGKQVRAFQPKKKRSYLTASIILGGMIGERLYHGYRKKLISMRSMQHLLKKNITHQGFENTYYEVMEIIESIPAPFVSKKEKM